MKDTTNTQAAKREIKKRVNTLIQKLCSKAIAGDVKVTRDTSRDTRELTRKSDRALIFHDMCVTLVLDSAGCMEMVVINGREIMKRDYKLILGSLDSETYSAIDDLENRLDYIPYETMIRMVEVAEKKIEELES